MTAIKICGVTTPEDALLAVDLGADLIGINVSPASPRYVDWVRAREIGAAVGTRALRVAVLVDVPWAEVRRAMDSGAFDLAQFHGREADADVIAFGAHRVLRAVALPADGGDRADDDDSASGMIAANGAATRARSLPGVWGLLVEARGRGGDFGGRGATWDYQRARDWASGYTGRWLLAGGLDPENVAGAIAAAQPWGVDVASGVELRGDRRRKDGERLRRFVAAVRQGDSEQGRGRRRDATTGR